MANNFEQYPGIDDCCYAENECRLLGCGARVAFGPGCAFDDLANIPWGEFTIPTDLLSFDLNETADIDTFRPIGSCYDICKNTGNHFDISGSYYFCAEDLAQCRSCQVGNCVTFCYIPCGGGFIYDVPNDQPDDPGEFGSNQVIPGTNPLLTGSAVIFGQGVVNSCSTSVTPDDYIAQNFSITGCGKLWKENLCNVATGPQGNPGGVVTDSDGPTFTNPDTGVTTGDTVQPG